VRRESWRRRRGFEGVGILRLRFAVRLAHDKLRSG
jgi:hypothetical protein